MKICGLCGETRNQITMTNKEALINYCLRLGDNNLILGQRMAEWCSNGPILEEDLAMTNLSLDHFGQAEFFYDYAAELEDKNRTADDIAYLRNEREYFNALIVEQPNGDFAVTMVRHMLFSYYLKHLYEKLALSSDKILNALSVRALKEIKYHVRHSSEWVIRLGLGTQESHKRTQNAVNELWRFTDDMFETNETDVVLTKARILPDLHVVKTLWLADVKSILAEANISIPENTYMLKGGYNANHTEHLGHLLCELQYLQRSVPGAKW